MSSAYVGIDPGARGAIAVIDDFGAWAVFDMPQQGATGARNVFRLIEAIQTTTHRAVVCIERQRAYGGQGVVSSCSLGQAYGWIHGVVDVWAGISGSDVHLVDPHDWQPVIIGRRSRSGPTAKERALVVAAEAAPRIELRTPRGRVLDGRVDAICIALYARQQWGGG